MPRLLFRSKAARKPRRALELYTQAGDRKKSAQLLERLRRYEEAARLWAELGQDERRQKCLNRLARRHTRARQQQLF